MVGITYDMKLIEHVQHMTRREIVSTRNSKDEKFLCQIEHGPNIHRQATARRQLIEPAERIRRKVETEAFVAESICLY